MQQRTIKTSEIYYKTLKELRRANQNRRRVMLTSGLVLLHDNARPHTAVRTGSCLTTFLTDLLSLLATITCLLI
jgi:hypothetical protein